VRNRWLSLGWKCGSLRLYSGTAKRNDGRPNRLPSTADSVSRDQTPY
jgi:hypothetical protein